MSTILRVLLILALACSGSTSLLAQQKIQVNNLTCEYQDNPLGLDVLQPRLSWKITSTLRNVKQKTYELRVGADAATLAHGKNITWQTGVVESGQSVNVLYGGPALTSRQRQYWQVKVTDYNGNSTGWSAVKFWEMGLLDETD